MKILVTGGAGYIGATLTGVLASAGHDVRAVDVLLYGQHEVWDEVGRRAETLVGDLRDASVRAAALDGCEAVVHLAAVVGDPACARRPQLAEDVNVAAGLALVEEAAARGLTRFVFASTCSNYGRLPDPTDPVDETGELRPVSLYARHKVAVEKHLLARRDIAAVCLRFATIYGVAPRMRFDLTVNEFTRDLWSGRKLEVFGEQFWRPYVHNRDAADAVRTVLEAPEDAVAGEVFNIGSTAENHRKLDIVEMVVRELGGGDVSFVHRDEDPRDYKVSFAKAAAKLGFEPAFTVRDGILEVREALDGGTLGDPFDPRCSNV